MAADINYSVGLSNINAIRKEISSAKSIKQSLKAKITSESKKARKYVSDYISTDEQGQETVDPGAQLKVQEIAKKLESHVDECTEVIDWLKQLMNIENELSEETDQDKLQRAQVLEDEAEYILEEHSNVDRILSSLMARLKGLNPTNTSIIPSTDEKQSKWKPDANLKPFLLQKTSTLAEFDKFQ